MMKLATIILLPLLVMQGANAQKTYIFKCGTTMFMCGTGLSTANICTNNGVANYVPKTLSECSDMIAAIASSSPFSQKCPVYGGKAASISHYVEYPTCNVKSGIKYDSSGPQVCTCSSGACGAPVCSSSSTSTSTSNVVTSPLTAAINNITTSTSPLITIPVVTPISPISPIVLPTASVGGDPHFRTHDGTMYSFHGECDLVMARSVSFDNGLGLDVHARTEMVGNTWSLVSNAAVRIGDDVFELNNNGTYYINNVPNAIIPATMANKYEIHYEEETVHHADDSIRTWHTIDLGSGDKVQITNFKNMISVNVAIKLLDMVGMLGTSGVSGLVARDGQSTISPDEMGAQWQVNAEEAILFNEMRSPQYPESCRLPEVSMTHRRLAAADESMTEKAKEVCHGVSDNLYDFCLYDVLISGNVELARTYTAGVF